MAAMTASSDVSPASATTELSAAVVVCAYTDKRWDDLSAGLSELLRQAHPQDRIIAVIDHNDDLLKRTKAEFVPQGVLVVPNAGTQGLSGARNTGVENAEADLILFLDDDALPGPGWIDAYRARFSEAQDIIGVGGAIEPAWEGKTAPRWFPIEFGWVVGCDYRGLPDSGEEIRNPIGASMAIRQTGFDAVGGFSDLVGRLGELPVGNEETELAIRIRQAMPAARIVRDTNSVVYHYVPKSRQTVKYFVSRCYYEGISKAATTSEVGSEDGLSSERAYVVKTLVKGMGLHASEALHGDPAGLARAVMLPVGLVATTFGFVRGKLRLKREAKQIAS